MISKSSYHYAILKFNTKPGYNIFNANSIEIDDKIL